MLRIKKLSFKTIDIEVFLLTVVCVCFLSPFIQRTIGTTGTLAIIGIYLVFEARYFFSISRYEQNTVFLILMYIGILLLYTFLGRSDAGAGQTNCIYFFLTFFLILPIYKRLQREHCAFIIVICTLAILITLAQNYALWIKMGFRFTQQWYKLARIKAVINTQYIGSIMLFSGILFAGFLYEKKEKKRFLFLAIVIICFAFNILVTQRTSTLLLSVIMFLVLALIRGKITQAKVIRYIFAILVIVFIALEYRTFLNWLSSIFNSERMKKRIDSIITLLTVRNIDNVEDGSLKARISLIGVSLGTFFSSISNFMFGVGDKADNLLVGNHSQFFDEFAKFGLFGSFISFLSVFRMIKTTKLASGVEGGDLLNKMHNVMICIMIIRSLVGGIFVPSTGIVMLVILPLIFRIMKLDQLNWLDETEII